MAIHEQKPLNGAQILLLSIGGTAVLVSGYDGHYWADNQMAKKGHKRPLKGRGNYGRNLMAHFAEVRSTKAKLH